MQIGIRNQHYQKIVICTGITPKKLFQSLQSPILTLIINRINLKSHCWNSYISLLTNNTLICSRYVKKVFFIQTVGIYGISSKHSVSFQCKI